MSSGLRVYVISRPTLDQSELERFLADESLSFQRTLEASSAEEIVEVAGRICYMSFRQQPKRHSTAQYIRNLIDRGHESVLEHISWSLIVTGLTRACTHQLVRHRAGFAFSQLSQQYHDESSTEFIEPHAIKQFSTRNAWAKCEEAIRSAYREIVDELDRQNDAIASILWPEGQPPDDAERKREISRYVRSAARSLLPNATATKICVSANARAWRHFFTVRGCLPGDEEMRRLAAAVLLAISSDAPSLFGDFRVITLPDGSSQVVKEDE